MYNIHVKHKAAHYNISSTRAKEIFIQRQTQVYTPSWVLRHGQEPERNNDRNSRTNLILEHVNGMEWQCCRYSDRDFFAMGHFEMRSHETPVSYFGRDEDVLVED